MDWAGLVNTIQNTPWLFTTLIIWSVVWKGIALWYAARGNQLAWYIVLLVINTVGLLEIIYLAFFRRKQQITT